MALSINPSYQWEGNDGPWSTFALRVGTPPQLVRVLPSTSGSETWVIHPQGCGKKSIANCSTRRGEIFQYNLSTTFSNLSPPGGDPYFKLDFDLEKDLGKDYEGSALVGVDTISLGGEGDVIPALEHQVVAAYADTFPFMGLLGLSARNATIVNATDQHESILGALKAAGEIATEYWAYTAGAPYRPPEGKQYASLTFGGYDAKRGDIKDGLVVPIGADQDMLVSITGITLDMVSGSTSVGGLPISTFIDSMVPEIWLPLSACSTFESAFGLAWNDTAERYSINDTQHDTLKARNPNITLTLAASDTPKAKTIDIVLPYLAFDLTTDTERYFPLKRASNDSQYFLGRTFLQEAYLAVNYDRSEFTIAQATFPPGNDERDIVVVRRGTGRNSGLSKAAIAGISIGAVAAFALIVGRILWFWHQRRRAKERRWGTIRHESLGGTTVNDKSEDLRSWLKPLESVKSDLDDVKPELDANATARFVSIPHRHELDAVEGEVWTNSQQSLATKGGEPSPPVELELSSPVELDGSQTVLGQPSPAVSPMQNSEISSSPLPFGHPSPPGDSSSPTGGRRGSLGRLRSFFTEFQTGPSTRNPAVEQMPGEAEMTQERPEIVSMKSLPEAKVKE